MYRLIKISSPGWTKEFENEGDVTFELSEHLCESCFELYGDSLKEMLESICGLEFNCTGSDDFPETPLTLSCLTTNLPGISHE